MGETSLAHAVEQLRTTQRLIDVLEVVRSTARSMVSADGATVVLREDDNCFYADEDAMSPLWKGQRFPANTCISGWAMLNGQVAVVRDITADDRIPIEAYRPTFVKSLAMVPVGTHPSVGAIGTYWAHHHAASQSEIAALEELAGATAAALHRLGLDEAPYAPSTLRAPLDTQLVT